MQYEALRSLSVVERVKSKYVITPENLPYFILPFDRVANVFMGSPLFVNEQLYFIQKRKQFGPKKTRFTDYLQGSDGTLLFTLDTTTCKTGYYPVGLQAEKSNLGTVEQKEIPIPIDTKFVLNSQGSTYNKQVWLLLLSLLQEKKLFSINST